MCRSFRPARTCEIVRDAAFVMQHVRWGATAGCANRGRAPIAGRTRPEAYPRGIAKTKDSLGRIRHLKDPPGEVVTHNDGGGA